MKILYFDCFSGISGDMTIGALLDLGADEARLRKELSMLNLDGYELIIEKKASNGITGTDVTVLLEEEHAHDHGHNNTHSERNLSDIVQIIDKSSLSQGVKEFGKAVFHEIAKAEAKVHGKGINEVHFHEVGAIDSIIDIVATAICLELLGVEKVYSSALHDGRGFIECRHGVIPVPVPAVMEMLSGSGIPLVSEEVGTELVTPTGMGLIKHISSSFGKMPPMVVGATGYGLGKRETGRLNALRVFLGEAYIDDNKMEKNQGFDEIAVLETNIDDTSSEILGYATERLFKAGALDVYHTPIYMKKGRPAYLLTVLARPKDQDRLADIILTETSTLGVRRSFCERRCMKRDTVAVSTEYGEARVKIANFDEVNYETDDLGSSGFHKAAPEYEDCRVIAEKSGLPLAKVYEMVMRNAAKQYGV